MKFLVTGGAGFIGSHVVDAFLAAGHEVLVIDNLSKGKRENLNPKATFYNVDIRGDEIAEIFAQEKPTVVCHHAAQMDVRRAVGEPQFDASVNVVGSVNVLENARRCGVKKLSTRLRVERCMRSRLLFPWMRATPSRHLHPTV